MRFAVQANACIGSHGTEHGWFDERQHPLTVGAATPQASLAAVQDWLWTILDALKLDPECLIISLVLLERAPPHPPRTRPRPALPRPVFPPPPRPAPPRPSPPRPAP